MTRANPRGPRFNLDPEIERTQKQLKRRIRDLMDVNRNNGQQPADGQELPAQADGAIAPPAQQMNQQLPARTVRDYLAEDLEGLNPAVTMPYFEAEHFELKPVMFNMLNTLGQFGGTPNENARQYVKSFLEICNSFKIHGVSNDVLKLKLFPYSLRDKAKTWLNNIQPDSLQSWTQLCRCFLAKFSYTNMTDHLRNQITSFRQEDDKAMHEAWEHYRDLFRRCPMHGLPEWTQVSIFYNSVNTPTRMILDGSANGTLLDKPPRESLEILDKLAQNVYQHPTSRRGNTRRGPAQLDSSDNILAQIANLTNMGKSARYTLLVSNKVSRPVGTYAQLARVNSTIRYRSVEPYLRVWLEGCVCVGHNGDQEGLEHMCFGDVVEFDYLVVLDSKGKIYKLYEMCIIKILYMTFW
ncbi:hypothetical protein GQ457_07G006580 [Hibiscus cannabinus]